jgi:transcriptional regulator with XRE-family HTH domain
MADPAIPPPDVDIRVILRESAHNKRAIAILKDHQYSVGMTQEEFAVELSKEFRGRIAMTTISGYMTGRSNVPAAVLLAAAAIAQGINGTQPVSLEERILSGQKRIEAGVNYLIACTSEAGDARQDQRQPEAPRGAILTRQYGTGGAIKRIAPGLFRAQPSIGGKRYSVSAATKAGVTKGIRKLYADVEAKDS